MGCVNSKPPAEEERSPARRSSAARHSAQVECDGDERGAAAGEADGGGDPQLDESHGALAALAASNKQMSFVNILSKLKRREDIENEARASTRDVSVRDVSQFLDDADRPSPVGEVKLHLLRLSTNCHGPWILLEQAGVKHELVDVDLLRGDTRADAFLAMNPSHTVPTLQHDGYCIWESNAIMRYVCGAFPEARRFYPFDDPAEMARTELALDFRQLTLNAAISILAYPVLGFGAATEEGTAAAVSKLTAPGDGAFAVLTGRLLDGGAREFVGGGSPNVADFALLSACTLLRVVPSVPVPAAVAAYLERVSEAVAYDEFLDGKGGYGATAFLAEIRAKRGEDPSAGPAAATDGGECAENDESRTTDAVQTEAPQPEQPSEGECAENTGIQTEAAQPEQASEGKCAENTGIQTEAAQPEQASEGESAENDASRTTDAIQAETAKPEQPSEGEKGAENGGEQTPGIARGEAVHTESVEPEHPSAGPAATPDGECAVNNGERATDAVQTEAAHPEQRSEGECAENGGEQTAVHTETVEPELPAKGECADADTEAAQTEAVEPGHPSASEGGCDPAATAEGECAGSDGSPPSDANPGTHAAARARHADPLPAENGGSADQSTEGRPATGASSSDGDPEESAPNGGSNRDIPSADAGVGAAEAEGNGRGGEAEETLGIEKPADEVLSGGGGGAAEGGSA
ncbi:Glutathione S-transferase D6 [Diplonema papillatum]|nr:Glutathione S-transferase D6 [Diplonema papillatum]